MTTPPPSTPDAQAAHAPSGTRGRIRSLDVLRGIAILGTLGSNITIFVTEAYGDSGPFDGMIEQLTNGKFLALLTLMFGIGLAIQADAAARRQQRWPLVYLWRGILLFIDGVLHYILVFAYDVLMAYSITGIVVSYILLTSKGVQRAIFAVAATTHVALILLPTFGVSLPFLGSFGGASTSRDDGTPGQLESLSGAGASEADLSTWWGEVVYRLETFVEGREEAVFILPMAVALFILGSWLFQRGLLDERGRVMRRWLMGIGALGFLVDMAAAQMPDLVVIPGVGGRYLVPIFVAFGIAGAVPAFYLWRPKVGFVGRRLEDVGRTALSCYIGQNVLGMVLFAPWGLDVARFFPEIGWALSNVMFGWVLITVLIVVFARVSLATIGKGPVEWLWTKSYDGLMRLTPSWGRRGDARDTHLARA